MKARLQGKKALPFFLIPILAGILLGFLCLSVPKPYTGSDLTQFSAENAARFIGKIAQKPHSVFDTKEHDAVLRYLVSQLEALGAEVNTREYTIEYDDEDSHALNITNIHGLIDGISDDAILLVAHYDSVMNFDRTTWKPLPGISCGAADDGYGVGVILETVRAIQAQGLPLSNDLMILFTDAEEMGMAGTEEEMKHNLSAFRDVRLVINVEARGVKGPAVMFETGSNNAAVIDFYLANAKNPFSYSFATDVYRNMPNATDFTEFLSKGFTGLNFSVLDSLDYYHNEKDNLRNINLASLQHYGNQIHAMISTFVHTPQGKLPDFNSNHNKIFFSVPGNLISYSGGFALIQLLLAAALIIGALITGLKRREITLSGLFKSMAVLLAAIICAGLLGTLVVYIAALISGKTFRLVNLRGIPGDGIILMAVIVLSAFFQVIMLRRLKKKDPAGIEAAAGATLLNLVLGFLTYALLPGTSYLFTIPACLTAAYTLAKGCSKRGFAVSIAYTLTALAVPVLFIAPLYLIHLSLTIGSAGIVAALAIAGLASLTPLVNSELRSHE